MCFFAGKKKVLAQNSNAYDVEYKRFALPLQRIVQKFVSA